MWEYKSSKQKNNTWNGLFIGSFFTDCLCMLDAVRRSKPHMESKWHAVEVEDVETHLCRWPGNAASITWRSQNKAYIFVWHSASFSYLQCTTMCLQGKVMLSLTSFRKRRRLFSCLGTPKSGQLLKWYCFTNRFFSPWSSVNTVFVKNLLVMLFQKFK